MSGSEKQTPNKGKETQQTLQGHVSGQSNEPLTRPAHALTHEQVVAELTSDAESGISKAEAERRLGQYGRNDIGEGEGISPVKILVAQVANAMTLVSCGDALPTVADILIIFSRSSSWLWPSASPSGLTSKEASSL